MNEPLPHFRCLVVEDNRDHAELICLALKQESPECTIDLVEDGSEAIDYLYQRDRFNHIDELPDIVLLDLHLKKVDGIEVLKTIRNDDNLRHLTVFVLTSSGSALNRMKAEVYGADKFLDKPADYHEFVCMIKHLQMYLVKNDEPETRLRLAGD